MKSYSGSSPVFHRILTPDPDSGPKKQNPGGVDSGTLCQAKFLTRKISDFTPSTHEQNNILHIKYAKKTYDWGLGIRVQVSLTGYGEKKNSGQRPSSQIFNG